MTKLNSSTVEQLGGIFFNKTKIVSKEIDGSQFITIHLEEEGKDKEIKKGFGTTTISGSHIIPMMKIIEGTHFVNSITTVVYKKKISTDILICENSAREDIEN